MKLPYTPQALVHRSGGTILEVVGITHIAARPKDGRSQDEWFYLCRVRWSDGKGDESEVHPVHPIRVCFEGASGSPGHLEVCALSELLNVYLHEHGQWRDDEIEGWYANARRPDQCPAKSRKSRRAA